MPESPVNTPAFWIAFVLAEAAIQMIVPSKPWAGAVMLVLALCFLASAFGWLPAITRVLAWRQSLIIFILIGASAGAGVWAVFFRTAAQSLGPSATADALNNQPHGTTETPAPPKFPASIRLKYSSRQVLQISNVPGDYNQTLNLDNVATLRLTPPFNRE